MLRHPGSLIGIGEAKRHGNAVSPNKPVSVGAVLSEQMTSSTIPSRTSLGSNQSTKDWEEKLFSDSLRSETCDYRVRPRRSLLPIWEGTLKQKKSKGFGLGFDVWRDRFTRLDPQSGLLSIWSIKEGHESLASSVMSAKFRSDATGPPKKQFELSCIRRLDSNPHDLDIMIQFSAKAKKKKVEYALWFRAPTLEDYNRWMFVLSHFGIRHDIPGLDVEMRGILKRAFPSRDRGLKADDSRGGGADDTEFVNSIAVSDSTKRNIVSLDDNVLGELSTALEGISPCNSTWCRKVGLKPSLGAA
jgi:hypothetical protein